MLCYLLGVFIFLELCTFSNGVVTVTGDNCKASATDEKSKWTFPNGVIFDCVIMAKTKSGSPLTITVDKSLEFKKNVGSTDFPIQNLQINRGSSSGEMIAKVAGDIITSGDQIFGVDLSFTGSGNQQMLSNGVINFNRNVVKSTSGSLSVQTSKTGSLQVGKNFTAAGDISLKANSIQFGGPLLESTSGGIALLGEFLFTGTVAQSISCAKGSLTALSFTKSTTSGLVSIQAKPQAGTVSSGTVVPAGIHMSTPGTINIQSVQGLVVSSPITTPGSISCSGGPLTLSDVQLTGTTKSGSQNIVGDGAVKIGDITQINPISLTLTSSNSNLITGDIRVKGDLVVRSVSSIKNLISNTSATFYKDMTISGDVSTKVKFECQGQVTLAMAGSATQTINGGSNLQIAGDCIRGTGSLFLIGTQINVGGNVAVSSGPLQVNAVGTDPHSQFSKDVTAVGITLTGACNLLSTSTQTLDAGTGQFSIRSSLSKDKGDLILKGKQFDIAGNVAANYGSMTFSGATSFKASGSFMAGANLIFPSSELVLNGGASQTIQASSQQSVNTQIKATNSISKTETGSLTLRATIINLGNSVSVSKGGLAISGQVNATGMLSATETLDLTNGQVYDNIVGQIITINGELNMAGKGIQKITSVNSVLAKKSITKAKGDLLIVGPSSIALRSSVTVTAGQLNLQSNQKAQVYSDLTADSMNLCGLLLLGPAAQAITAKTISAKEMSKQEVGDLTVKVSVQLQITAPWATFKKTSSLIFSKISPSNTPTFNCKSTIKSGKDLIIGYPIVLYGTGDQSLEAVNGVLRCQDITKTLQGVQLTGPKGVFITGSSVTVSTNIVISGSLTTNVANIQAMKQVTVLGSATFTGTSSQKISAASFTLGSVVSSGPDIGGVVKAQGDLSIALTSGLIMYGNVSVTNGVLDVAGSTSGQISCTNIIASVINFHGFSQVISLLSSTTQTFRATGGKLQIGGALAKTNPGKLILDGKTGITIGGSLTSNGGDLLVNSVLTTGATQIIVAGSATFKGSIMLTSSALTELKMSSKILNVAGSITKQSGDFSIFNLLGKVYLNGDVTLGSGSLSISGLVYGYGSMSASTLLEFQNNVQLLKIGDQALHSKVCKFAGQQAVSLTKVNGALSLGYESDPDQSTIQFIGTGTLAVWNGSLTVHGTLTIEKNVWADKAITVNSVTMTGASLQSIISLSGCLTVKGNLVKNANHLVVGKDCIKLGTLTNVKGGQLVRCGPTAVDPCSATTLCKSSKWSGSKSRASSCPASPPRPTASPTASPTSPPTPSPTKTGETPQPTPPPTKSPIKTGPTPPPPTPSPTLAPPTASREKVKDNKGLSAAAIVGIIVVVLAIPGIAILIWLCLRSRSKDADREVLLSDDVGEYQAPNA